MKKLIPKIFFFVLFIILVISIIIAITQNTHDRTIKMYNNLINKENYTLKIVEENKDINYSITMAKKDSYTSIDTVSNDEHTTTLVKDDIAYYVMHNTGEYYLYDSKQIEADILIDDLKEIDKKEYKKGHETINGKDYYYEEYQGISAFILWLDHEEDENEIKTRFYFDGNNIKYIKNILEDEEELLKVELLTKVEDKLFEIPSDYAEIE